MPRFSLPGSKSEIKYNEAEIPSGYRTHREMFKIYSAGLSSKMIASFIIPHYEVRMKLVALRCGWGKPVVSPFFHEEDYKQAIIDFLETAVQVSPIEYTSALLPDIKRFKIII